MEKKVFKVELIESNIPENKKCEKEIYYIKKFNSFYYTNKQFGYNMTIGGNGTVGYLFTNTDKQKISQKGIGRKFSKERNEKIRKAMTGRYFPKEWRDKISEFAKTRTGDKNPFYGKNHTDKTKNIISNCNTKYQINMYSNDMVLIKQFKNTKSAAEWIWENNLSTSVHLDATEQLIRKYSNKLDKKLLYGYIWESIKVK